MFSLKQIIEMAFSALSPFFLSLSLLYFPGSYGSCISSSHAASVNRPPCQFEGLVAGWKPLDRNTCSKLIMHFMSMFYSLFQSYC